MRSGRFVLVALLGVASATTAQPPAEPVEEPEDGSAREDATGDPAGVGQAETVAPRPWAEGVLEQARAAALARFTDANAAFARSDYGEAARLYREALAHWDHPAIHGNLAVALVHLDQPIVAFEHLELALRWGSRPFEAQQFQQLETNHRLLRGQLARIVVRSDAEGAEIVLDGERLFVAPGEAERVVRAGSHRVVATLAGHLTSLEEVVLAGGDERTVEPVFVSLDEAARYERRFSTALPWSVLGAGVAVALAGVGLQVSAARLLADYESEIDQRCPSGCTPDELSQAVLDQRTDGERRNAFAVAAMVLGGAATAAGVVLLVLNQPRRVEVGADGRQLSLSPHFGPRTIGLTLDATF